MNVLKCSGSITDATAAGESTTEGKGVTDRAGGKVAVFGAGGKRTGGAGGKRQEESNRSRTVIETEEMLLYLYN